MPLHIKRRRGLRPFDVRALRRRAQRLMRLLAVQDRELSVLITDDTEMTQLNRCYRQRNRPTDVLSFSQAEGPRGRLHPEILGDVVISLPTARRQARERRVPLMAELTLLLVHGVLHLLGHDHQSGHRQRTGAMRREQARLVAVLEGQRRP